MRARYMGMLSLCFASGSVLGVPLGGEVLARFGGGALWYFSMGMPVLAGLLYFAIRRRIAEHQRLGG